MEAAMKVLVVHLRGAIYGASEAAGEQDGL